MITLVKLDFVFHRISDAMYLNNTVLSQDNILLKMGQEGRKYPNKNIRKIHNNFF